MNKYRVLKPYPKQITNSGRLITLKHGASVYLKKEPQVLRLVSMGYIKPVIELVKRPKKAKKVKAVEVQPQVEKKSKKSEYLNKKNKGKVDSKESN